MMAGRLQSPFPYFGGKSTVAAEVWRRFGNVPNYVEPFFGSGAVLLGRPRLFDGVETVNDADGMVCNFWRAVQAVPAEVARWADWPVNENDLHARHIWLVERKESLQARLEGEPDFYDAKAAGWWCWGVCCWIGSGWCFGNGPWQVQEVDGVRQLIHLGDAGRGVNRQLIHLRDAGRGVNRQREESGIYAWMEALAERLARVRVCCGDWRRVCGGNSGDSLNHFFAGGNRCAVFLDPPYSAEANRDGNLYAKEDLDVAHAVREWAVEHGDDKRLRICLAGYDGEHVMPATWSAFAWKTRGGYASRADGDTQGKANCKREMLWFSPHCATKRQGDLFPDEVPTARTEVMR